MITLYHCTPYARSVLQSGLDPEHSQGAVKRVWLCDYERLPWALCHVREWHKDGRALVILEVQVEESTLKRRRDGVYWTYDHIPANQIRLWLA